jgi:ATP-dependent exoDNAse (exonuclease V) alpha subunit
MHDPISYGYASTTHKATGQTFDKVFVIDDDFQGAKLPTRNRLRYTAITRARETAYIISRSI